LKFGSDGFGLKSVPILLGFFSGCSSGMTSTGGGAGLNPKKGHVEVDYTNDSMSENQCDICSEQTAHRMSKQDDIRPLIFMGG
jgi:hypothetical protein